MLIVANRAKNTPTHNMRNGVIKGAFLQLLQNSDMTGFMLVIKLF